MSTSYHLYAQANAAAARAEQCRTVATTLETRRAAMVQRHHPVVELHTDDVWRGRAANASRIRMRSVVGRGLHLLGVDLSGVAHALRAKAVGLDETASLLRQRAREAATREALEA